MLIILIIIKMTSQLFTAPSLPDWRPNRAGQAPIQKLGQRKEEEEEGVGAKLYLNEVVLFTIISSFFFGLLPSLKKIILVVYEEINRCPNIRLNGFCRYISRHH